MLSKHGLIEESEGARVIFIEGKNIPLIVVKRDGGYNYASTDLAALWLVPNFTCLFLDAYFIIRSWSFSLVVFVSVYLTVFL